MSLGNAKPLLWTAGWAAGSFLAAMALHAGTGRSFELSARAAALFLGGALYTNLFEHAWHRFAMHSRLPDPRHAQHHQIFYGQRFQTSDPAALREITTAWYIFPLLLALHYAAFVWLLPPALAPAFFFGVAVHFLTYEVTHWYTHVANNGFDPFISRIPGLRHIRAAQIRHHRMHHADPLINFNFNPPYAGDWMGGVLRR